MRLRWVLKELKQLNEDKATGPDLLPGRVLKHCAQTLAPAVTQLVRLLLAQGRWPEFWRLHWIAPLHKKGSQANPGNYRGVHLTPVLSKVVERVVNRLLGPYFESTNAFGASQ